MILLGDLVNKGPEVLRTLEYVWRSGFECLMGNHEAHFLANLKKIARYRALWKELGKEMRLWIKGLPYFIDDPAFLAVHAGVEPGIPLTSQRRDVLLNVREWPQEGRAGGPPTRPWYDYYVGTKPVVYGHWARQGLRIRSQTVGLDSGCVYGGKLSGWILETREIRQVDARKRYAETQSGTDAP